MNQQVRRTTLALAVLAGAATLSPAQRPDVARFSRFDAQLRPVLEKMTVDEKVGQMLEADQQFLQSLDDIEKYHMGSILSGGDSDPKSGNDLQSWIDLYERVEAHAPTAGGRKIPLIYGVDAVHGHNNVEGATIFPHNIGLGATRDAGLVERISRITAEEVRATGIPWAFAPCVTVPQDIRWGRTYEGFGETPDIVRPLGLAAVKGLQGDNLSGATQVVACAKHLAGDGGTQYGSGLRDLMDHGNTVVDEATFRRIHLPAYKDAIAAGVGTIMPSYNSWNGIRCSANHRLLTEIIKGEFGFEGFLISDYNAIDEIPGDYKAQIRQSVMAGMDMFMVPQKYVLFFDDLKQLVTDGTIPMQRIDDAVLRIMRVKAAMGLLDPNHTLTADRSLQQSFGSAEHRAVARQAVSESLVLLKNDGHVLPISKSAKRIHIAGKSADDLGNQCGGWTITWQGKSGNVTKGTTLKQAVEAAVTSGTKVSYSPDGSGAEGADVAILVVGEKPYAEMFGDRKLAELSLDADDKAALQKLKQAGVPTAVVIFSGRPLFIDDVLDQAGAWVAAWLPGTEGAGLSDVLLGNVKPTGKLSFTWPKSTSTSLHRGDAGYQTQFPLGYGLTY